MNKTVEFRYGMLCDDLEKQANEQGFTLGDEAEMLERLRFSLNMCAFHGILTDSETNKAFERFHKKVMKALKESEEK